jgi:hypothetical protein
VHLTERPHRRGEIGDRRLVDHVAREGFRDPASAGDGADGVGQRAAVAATR